MKSHYQAVIIGGGVVGASVLYHLTKKGWRDIALLERLELTAGSTWHAAGGMHTINGDPNVAKLQQYSINLYKEIEEISGQSVGLHMTEGMMLAATKPRWEWLKSIHSKGRYMGMQTELISLDEAERLLPLIDKSQFVGAMYDPIQGHVDPNGTTYAFAGAARKAGAEVYTQTRVLDTRQRSDGSWDVITDKGTIIAEHVVNCGGLWAREVGRMVGLELPILAMEHQYLITEDMPEVEEINRTTGKMVLHAVDFDGEIYMRQERKGMLLGTYERHGVPWSPKDTPWDFGPTLLPDALERMADNLEVGFRHFPAFQRAGIKKVINGPFTFAPDGNPLVGPIAGLSNYWVACGVMAGFSQGGGVGLALSNWMADGDPGFDVWAMDVARYGDWATRAYTRTKVIENYGRRFRVRFPNEELPAGRPLRTTPMYHKWRELGAVMGDNWGLEAPLWFAPEGVEDEFSFHRSTDFAHVKAECRAVRHGVGISETSTFAKYEISGPGAEAWLAHLLANKMPRTGRLSLSPMLNERGKLIGDFTVAKAADERFYVFGSGAAEKYHMRWFETHLPQDGSVTLRTLGLTLTGLSIAGPKAREVMARLTDDDVSAAAFKFMDFRPKMELGPVQAMVGRVSFTGDLGFEIWVQAEHQVALFEALWAAGEEFGIRPFGSRALLSLAREKGFGTWAREFRPIYGPFEAGLGRFVDLTKNDFIGRAAAAIEKADGPERQRVSFVVEAGDADAIGDEAVWKDGAVVGWITSGGYAHHADRSYATGYVPSAALANGAAHAKWEIEILGERRPAALQMEPLFDPAGARMRG
ncbi:FAD-dependent oxidoreductase [Bosea vestrisii]|uniref:GcvT family protein n=1 Tax=Bosea vestrisii TaxID=151416 RepID=UPI0024E0064E|nr:FAD-dependent oxidoreductase [Bosea vestrisii]WID96634.1 FAD-dependent oxidoreductase [Bosea vestrisii]